MINGSSNIKSSTLQEHIQPKDKTNIFHKEAKLFFEGLNPNTEI